MIAIAILIAIVVPWIHEHRHPTPQPSRPIVQKVERLPLHPIYNHRIRKENHRGS